MTTHSPEPAPTAQFLQSKLLAYDQFEMIAIGGMGAVYRARQVSLDRPVAIKVLTHACSAAPQFREIFQAEAKVMARLNHPNLVSIYDYGEVDHMLFIVMELVEGRSLHDACYGQAVKQHEAGQLVSTLANSLSHAHYAGILHRDIKPANILIDDQIRPVIVDFGLAHESSETTAKGDTVFGTPGYTAPEVLVPPYKADQRADIFSLGVLLHELLTGETPRSPYVPPSQIADVDPRYDAVISRAIHPLAAMRYSLAEELANDLDAIVSGKQLRTSSLLMPPSQLPQQPAHSKPLAASTPAPILNSPVVAQPTLGQNVQTTPTTHHTKWAIAASLAAALVVTSLATVGAEEDSSNPEAESITQQAAEKQNSPDNLRE